MTDVRHADPFAVIADERIADVLRRLYREANRQHFSVVRHLSRHALSFLRGRAVDFPMAEMAGFWSDKYIAIVEPQGAFCYLTARARRARTIVEFGTSFGVSTLWLAAAVKANGGGTVVTTEIVPEKAAVARQNFEEAGVADIIDLRVGDALESLREEPSDIDFLLNDGFPMLALDVVQLLARRMRPGAVVLTDDVGGLAGNFRDYVAWLRDPANGFDSTLLPLKGGSEYSVRR
ncbi:MULTISPECIES: O-methyltransferase [Sphingomonadaceae]|uniref:O-methyltransferase n=1 Tax=Sphingomonadales TaxID=204457 RepID=UPI00076FEC18|nr:class I SAM-dependent methyltransferase [Sphingobium sp. TKS]AMK23166.1 O-methyltransferase family protein [Sphingobium sp. TKS]MCF8707598.1 class I SAM-dependent methyltransferase [Rhizorhapis sp. SPR117]